MAQTTHEASDEIPGTIIFDGRQAVHGYALLTARGESHRL